MRTIHKFEVPPVFGGTTVELPLDADVLCVHEQHGQPHIWVRFETDAPRIKRTFLCVGTGQDISGKLIAYHGTAFCGPLVWHVFEKVG